MCYRSDFAKVDILLLKDHKTLHSMYSFVLLKVWTFVEIVLAGYDKLIIVTFEIHVRSMTPVKCAGMLIKLSVTLRNHARATCWLCNALAPYYVAWGICHAEGEKTDMNTKGMMWAKSPRSITWLCAKDFMMKRMKVQIFGATVHLTAP